MKIKVFVSVFLVALMFGCTPATTPAAESETAPAAEIETAPTAESAPVLSEVPVVTKVDKAWNVGLVYKGTNNEWSVTMADQAIAHGKELGVNLTAQGLANDNDIEEQINIVDNMIAQNMDAIVIAPTDAKALVPVVVKAMEAGIVVVNVDSQLDQDLLKAAGVTVPYVGPDNVAAGLASGGCLGALLPEGAKIIILEGAPGAANGLQRKAGFEKAIEKYKFELVVSETAQWDTNTAFTVFTDLLTAHPDVQGVMAANDNMALGAIQAISAANLDIPVVGFDNVSASQAAILAGTQICTIEQYGGDVAAQGIDVAVAELQGAKFSGVVTTPFVLIDKAAVEAMGAPVLSEVPVVTKVDKAWNVGLVYKGTNNEWSVTMADQAIAHGKELGVNLTAQGLANDNDIEEQINIVDNMIAQNMDAIVIAPTDAKALVPVVVKAMEAGIVVVNVDSQLDQDLLKAAGVTVPYVGPDNVAAGLASGGCLGALLPEGAKIIILEGAPGAANGLQRKAGFEKAIEKYKFELVVSETAQWDTNTAFTVFTDLLTAHPDVQGVMAANDNMALGAIQAISAANLDIPVVGFDNVSASQAAILAGTQICTIEQYGGDVAAQGIDVAVAELQGAKFSGVVTTPFVLIDKAAVEAK